MSYPPVPYVSQIDNAPAKNDCGAACVLMLAKWMNTQRNYTVDTLAASIGKLGQLTGKPDIEAMLRNVKLTPISGAALSYPYIALVRYKDLPSRYSSSFDYSNGVPVLHWVVRLDELTYHDPLYLGTAGANKAITPAQWAKAEVGVSYRTGITQRPAQTTMAEPARTPYERVYHVINSDATEEQAVEIFRKAFRNNRQTVGFSYDDAGVGDGLKSKTAIIYGIPQTQQASFTTFYKQWYPSVSVQFAGQPTTPTTPPVTPPQPTGSAIGVHQALPYLPINKRLGVHVLERIEEAREAFNLGCRAFTMLGNIAGAREMRAKGCAVIVRNYMPGGQLWSVDQFIQSFGVNADDSFIIMGINEADNISTSDIDRRFTYERDFALKMHALSPKSFIVIGGFSMGTPQLDDAAVAQRFRNTYGAFLNANASWCGLNYHSYHRRHSGTVPPASQPVEDPVWWPKRFLQWGYNAQSGGLNSNVVMVSDEAGVDIGGIGGFAACGYDDNTFAEWWKMQRAWFEPVPQVYIQNVFQLSPRADWAGYNARCVLGGMAKVWQNTAPAVREALMPEVYEGEAPGANWNPPMKDLSSGLDVGGELARDEDLDEEGRRIRALIRGG